MQGKLFIASDIHGSAFWCEKLLTAFEKENATRLILLGDILYHGPRNDFPDDYAPPYHDRIFKRFRKLYLPYGKARFL